LHAICMVCGDLATRNQRLLHGEPAPAEGPTVQVGAGESYEARCRACHEVPRVDRGQIELGIASPAPRRDPRAIRLR
jgi:thymidine kinase